MQQSKSMPESNNRQSMTFEDFRADVMRDFTVAALSREISLIGRKEVLTGKAKFGIFGDGKEVAQIAMARVFREGDFRSGYYRDQTFMFASGMATPEQFFAQLYAIPDIEKDPFSGGRQMNAHFATRSLDAQGNWKDLTTMKNSSSDTSPTASQMARAVGLGLASKLYRANPGDHTRGFSKNGDEVVFATIGDASTSEGLFWESVNAAGVLKIPMAVCVWDDGYGISVPQRYQTTKQNISEILSGFQLDEDGNGIRIYEVKGWDYPALVQTFEEGIDLCRREHIPVLFHVTEVTQPQGHSTSGSHERYKSKQRLDWEAEWDCIRQMRKWMIAASIATDEELNQIQAQARDQARDIQKRSWNEHLMSIKPDMDVLFSLLHALETASAQGQKVAAIAQELRSSMDAVRKDLMHAARQALHVTAGEESIERAALMAWMQDFAAINHQRYNGNLFSKSAHAIDQIPIVPAEYPSEPVMVNGFELLNKCFDAHFSTNPQLYAFGEDVGKIGDVNQGFAGLQDKYGEHRIFDAGIREATIIGQGIGMALRGMRPIAEIQYLDYLIYGLQPISDDLATLQYRTAGGQKAPLIIRTRGHRLEGIWHTGSPMTMILGTCRGVHLCVPRNMTQAAGMYNTLLRADEPAIVVECLNGYRLKESLPMNINTFTVPLGVPEILQQGSDITVVSYGSTLRVVQEAVERLEKLGMSIELIDVQTLLPFDITGIIRESVKRTNRILFVDEDVPGGATAYMQQQVFADESLFRYLDAFPRCLSAQPNRSAYASDGDYFCKPNEDDIFEAIYGMMHEVDPDSYPAIF
ncbi:MAG TPA: thiamine pyrophosphate-dependent enzyme [Chitinophagales bacterium]|nr:thiamine pyrophosphate-dependent enzyme [Chitinophagales bacterium]